MTKFSTLKKSLLILTAMMTFSLSSAVNAQNETLPDMPAPIKNLVDQGAQVRFLGKDHGVDGWVAIKNGQEQYFYVLPGQDGFISGILFDNNGKAVTIEQVKNLRAQGDDVLDKLAANSPDDLAQNNKEKKYEFKTPAEQLFWDVENSNWIPLGLAGTPVFYAFIDPQCPHCHAMMTELKSSLDDGKAQVRLIPVGRTDESRAQAAFLLASPDPQKTWWAHMAGDEAALPAKRSLSQQGVERNLSVMQSWKLSATPMVVYRAKDGSVKIVQGKPKDLAALIADLGARI